jgi:hypothetical protein
MINFGDIKTHGSTIKIFVENFALLGYYAVSSGKKITTTRCVIAQKSAVLSYAVAPSNHVNFY